MFRIATAIVLAVCLAFSVAATANAGIDGTLYVSNNTDKVVDVYVNGRPAINYVSPNTSPGVRIWDDPNCPVTLRAVAVDGSREWNEVVSNDVSNYNWTLSP